MVCVCGGGDDGGSRWLPLGVVCADWSVNVAVCVPEVEPTGLRKRRLRYMKLADISTKKHSKTKLVKKMD